MTLATFHLTADRFCPDADRVRVALDWCGTALEEARGATLLTVRRSGWPDMRVTDPLTMLDVIESLHPRQLEPPRDPCLRARLRDLILQAFVAQARLAAVTEALDPQDLDLAVHRLRGVLQRIETAARDLAPPPGAPLSPADFALAPLLWRMRALDLRAGAYLMSGFPVLWDWACRISDHLQSRGLVTKALEDDWLAALRGNRRAVVMPLPVRLAALAASAGSAA